jgi:glycosyltransferase involved in cell wall biosynthesis
MAKAIHLANIPFLVRSFHTALRSNQNNLEVQDFLAPFCTFPINCIVINPDMLHRLPSWIRLAEWTKRYNIGYWFWELGHFPKDWRYALPLIDEIWVNSEFNASTMRQVHKRVIKIPFAVEFELPAAQFTRTYFDLPKDEFLFVCSFDFHSSIHRKNPHAVIDAFLIAFTNQLSSVCLVIKSTHGDVYPQELAALKAYAKNDSRIIFIDQALTTEQVRGLLQCADCYVSLHRSEGLGMGMAESMYLGKPVIATAYSGNLEFMNSSNACLVDYQLIDVGLGQYPNAQNQVWAQADVETASCAMQDMITKPVWRDSLAAQARQDMLERHSFKVMGNAIALRLAQIERECASQ